MSSSQHRINPPSSFSSASKTRFLFLLFFYGVWGGNGKPFSNRAITDKPQKPLQYEKKTQPSPLSWWQSKSDTASISLPLPGPAARFISMCLVNRHSLKGTEAWWHLPRSSLAPSPEPVEEVHWQKKFIHIPNNLSKRLRRKLSLF